jgi:hypothetical protein
MKMQKQTHSQLAIMFELTQALAVGRISSASPKSWQSPTLSRGLAWTLFQPSGTRLSTSAR